MASSRSFKLLFKTLVPKCLKISAAAAIMLLFSTAFAQSGMSITASTNGDTYDPGETVTISGAVKDASNIPVPAAMISIQVKDPTDQTIYINVQYSSSDGSYTDHFVLANDSSTGSYGVFVAANKPGFADCHAQTSFSVPRSAVINQTSDFSISASPDARTIKPGESTQFSLSLVSIGGFASPISLGILNLPPSFETSFEPQVVGPNGSSTLTVRTQPTVKNGSYVLTITASASDPGITHTATVSLTVAGGTDTTISCSLSVATIGQGQNVTVSGLITPNPSASNDVILEYSMDGGSTWGTITTVKTDSGGSFSHVWSPGQGNYKVRSRWAGSATYNGATSSQQSLTVQPPSCIIATATYGSELSPEVQFLRGFREERVMPTLAGRQFLYTFNTFYYSFSPKVARLIESDNGLRALCKVALYPLISILMFTARLDSLFGFYREIGVIASGFVASVLIGSVYFSPIAIIVKKISRARGINLKVRFKEPILTILISSVVAISVGEAFPFYATMTVATAIFVLATVCLSAMLFMTFLDSCFKFFRV